jgi:chemosensory pili system protein ChpA (sensor histidine kinase/response regulator)
MRDIFLEEAREVIAAARQSLQQLAESPEDLGELTTVRSAFHTLKGSSRMVGLRDYGEAAWACEQLYNARLAQSPRLDGDLQAFTHDALDHLAAWTDAIAGGAGASHGPQAIIAAADSLRLHGLRIPVARRRGDDAAALVEPGPPEDLDGLPVLDVPAIPELQLELEPEALQLPPLPTLVDRVPDLPSASDLELDPSALPTPAVPAPDATLPLGPEAWPAQEPLEAPRVEAATEPEFELDLGLASVEGAGRVVLDAVAETTPLLPAGAGGSDSGERIELDFGALELAPAAAVDAPSDSTAVIDLGELTQPLPLGTTGQDAVSPAPVEPLDLDFADLEAQPMSAEAPAAAQALPAGPGLEDSSRAPEPLEAPEVIELDFGEDHPVESTQPLVGDLRIGIPLFNIYLNEADELSRRLGTELAEWSLEYERRPVPESAWRWRTRWPAVRPPWATASCRRWRVRSSMRCCARRRGPGTRGRAELFNEAADEIRRLLHQFAAGFLVSCAADAGGLARTDANTGWHSRCERCLGARRAARALDAEAACRAKTLSTTTRTSTATPSTPICSRSSRKKPKSCCRSCRRGCATG